MSQLIYARVRGNPKYQALVKRRGRLAAGGEGEQDDEREAWEHQGVRDVTGTGRSGARMVRGPRSKVK